ncbi:MAG TPA: methyltransferase domain-containing protein [Candidatus Diapherotrites archaeon]|uniref:Methyltransferase domain-containing protein n=1 Tax=Candidatus Iainarchaeum sp. TaxID=3101447 RepID=A0A7J4JGJ6_9ARCH|nr:methyltransferase domain-containing protein [Candidatus Diapherotrites archaeon]HIH16250.1 methyltransferase domain-containing protein [Candidatus Diapherotrites archaeon]
MTPKQKPCHLFRYEFLILNGLRKSLGRAVERELRFRHGLTLLDLGSQNPEYLHLFQGKAGQMVRLDIVKSTGIDVLGYGEQLPLKDQSMDVILCTQVLEHVRQPFEVVKEMHRVLKKGGMVFLTTHGNWRIHNEPEDNWRFTPDGFRELFKDYGTMRIENQVGTLASLIQWFNIYVKWIPRPGFLSQTLWHLFKAPFYVLPNVLGLLLDQPRQQSFCVNYLVTARK